MKNMVRLEALEPRRLAQQGIRLEDRIPLSSLLRVEQYAGENEAEEMAHSVVSAPERLKTTAEKSVGEDDAGAQFLQYTLEFSFGEDRTPLAHGRVSARLCLQCQRCLGPFQMDLGSTFILGFVGSDEAAARLPRDIEPVVHEGLLADVHSALEDELLLLIPAFPAHPAHLCPAAGSGDPGAVLSADQLEGKERNNTNTRKPFAGLADLLKK